MLSYFYKQNGGFSFLEVRMPKPEELVARLEPYAQRRYEIAEWFRARGYQVYWENGWLYYATGERVPDVERIPKPAYVRIRRRDRYRQMKVQRRREKWERAQHFKRLHQSHNRQDNFHSSH
ncbi:MAG: hypothetical protein KW804_00110 [Candidatus Doudnabacteria bacterium]|nr:hypothetical protein [Candidatus Doudnabacteria bacterium]